MPADTRAVAALRAGRKPAEDSKNLRQEVLALKKTTRDFRKHLDELRAESKSVASAKTTGPADSKSKEKI
jgi:hypothetical protein